MGYVFGLGSEYLNEFIPKVDAVTAKQVSAAVSKHFKLEQMVITVVGDAKEIRKSLDEAQARSLVRVELGQLM
jgi:predicted Zn-dependent peptidase